MKFAGGAPATRVTTPPMTGLPPIPPPASSTPSYKTPLIGAAAVVALAILAWAVYPMIKGPSADDPQQQTERLGSANPDVPTTSTTDTQSAAEKANLPQGEQGRGGQTTSSSKQTGSSTGTAPAGGGGQTGTPSGENTSNSFDAPAAIERQLSAVLGLGPDDRVKLRAIRDTALSAYEQVTNDALRAKAASAAANAFYQLQQRDEALKWAQKAVDLCPSNCSGYNLLLNLLKGSDH
jgi:hypothetical protein